jgi:sulfatase maturation enzyme AslB (radical SAM superfamily)
MKPFSLLIKPASADCNLRCEYCFYIDHLENVKKNLVSQQEKGEVRISSLRNREQKITKSVKELQEKLTAKS